MFFFFQAEDGIRDRNVTGVQTCALPILFGLSLLIDYSYPILHSIKENLFYYLPPIIITINNASCKEFIGIIYPYIVYYLINNSRFLHSFILCCLREVTLPSTISTTSIITIPCSVRMRVSNQSKYCHKVSLP